ncbi:phage terminase large subunit [Aquabacterium sp.]|uniref:phage terminase large subunit n=1 Tax=Aquabacterium sp. TaxID=1872578 RepID=UPI004037B491
MFCWLLWRHLNLPQPTPLQYDIAKYLQRGPKRRMVQAFRGVGKSWLTAGYVLWRLYKNPNERVLVVSASKDRADAFSVFVKRLIAEMPLLQHLQPDPSKGHRDSIVAFDVGPSEAAQAPSVRSVGINGQLTGGRATLIIADDVEVPKNSLTQTMRDKLAESVKEFDAVLVPEGEIIYLGTPQTEMSLYNALPERGYDIRVWPARYLPAAQHHKYKGRLAPIVANAVLNDPKLGDIGVGRGAPTEPSRFTDIDLLEREASYGRSGFALQFMLDTSLSDADRYPLRLSDLIVMDLDPDVAPVKIVWASGRDQLDEELESIGFPGDRWVKPMWTSVGVDGYTRYQGGLLFIDPSGRGKDETGWAVVYCLNGVLFLMDCGGFIDGYSQTTLQALADLAKKWKVNYVDAEDNFGDGMFKQLLKPYLARTWPCTINEDMRRVTTQKERRIIDTLEPVMNQHRLVVNKALVRKDMTNYNEHPGDEWQKYQLFYQMTRITKEKGALRHDDRLDALCGAVAYWTEAMNRDQDKAVEEHKEALLQADLDEFMLTCQGYSQEGSWLH